MILHLFRRAPRRDTIASLYGTIVAQARAPAFYREYGVPDTPNGRLEMISLHAILFVDRMKGEGQAARRLGQDLFAAFCSDMDASLREMGVGDLAVPRKMRAIGEAFYGRQAAYLAGLAAPEKEALAEALARNICEVEPSTDSARRLAAYVRRAVAELAVQGDEAFGRGELHFPDPQQVAAEAPPKDLWPAGTKQ